MQAGKNPDTGYSLRSPQKMTGASKSALSLPAIRSRSRRSDWVWRPRFRSCMYYYNGESFDNGWDLTMLGGYVGELEGGAYIPYSGNAVLTGHIIITGCVCEPQRTASEG